MSLFALGINYRSAAVREREKLAFSLHETPEVVDNLINNQAVEEAVVLSTCHRTEIYTVTKCHHSVKEWLRNEQRVNDYVMDNLLYEHCDGQVVKHLMSVASGLDSMILGEPQILGQLKRAYQSAVQQGTIGEHFQQLFPAVFATAKLVRSQTEIGCHPVTTAYAVIQLARQLFTQLSDCTVMLIGAGETIELVADYLYQHNVRRLIFANRTVERAHHLARRYYGVPIRFEEIATTLSQADVVISATASRLPILPHAVVCDAMKVRRNPMFIADLAMPRDVQEGVADLKDVYLYNIDDLQTVISENQRSRSAAKEEARAIIEVQAAHYLRRLRVHQAGDMIRSYREQMESWRNQELLKALGNLQKHQDPQKALHELARNLTNKFMHRPTVKLRDAAYSEHGELIRLLKELYEL